MDELARKICKDREATERIAFTGQAVDTGNEGYRQAKRRFELQIASISEVLDAQERLSEAVSNRNQAIAAYYLSLAELSRAMGAKEYSLQLQNLGSGNDS